MADDSNRSTVTGSALIIALLAALGIGPSLVRNVHGSDKNVSAQARAGDGPDASSDRGGEAPQHSAAALIERFLDTNYDQVHSSKPWSATAPSVGERTAWPQDDPRANYRLNFLIAIVPEPDTPPLRASFDSDMDAVQLALERGGFFLRVFDIPWISEAKAVSNEFNLGGELDFGSFADARPALRIEQSEPEQRSRNEPGIMLFYREVNQKGKKGNLELLFLVGDNETSGVNRTSLRSALDQIAWLSGWSKQSVEQPLQLIPIKASDRVTPFQDQQSINPPCHLYKLIENRNPVRAEELCDNSASPRLDAKSTALNSDPALQIKIVGPVYTSSASSLRNALVEWTEAFSIKPRISIISGNATSIYDELDLPRVDYQAVRISDSTILDTVKKVLVHSREPIVLVSEGTTYGSEASGYSKRSDANQTSARGPQIQRISYPVHISDLRTAYGKVAGVQADQLPRLGEQDLALPDEQDQSRLDIDLPAFSTRSAVYDQLVLDRLLATIEHEHARFVGITASDIEDLLFLVREIRDHCQDVQIFTTSADLMLAHSSNYADAAGILVFSTYPLFNEFQSGPDSRDLVQFPDEGAEGMFNATLVQLKPIFTQLELKSELLDYGNPFATPDRFNIYPSLWMSVVGRSGIYPVRIYSYSPDSSYHLYPGGVWQASPFQPGCPFIFGFFFAATAILVIWPCYRLLRPASHPQSAGKLTRAVTLDSIWSDLQCDRAFQRATLFVVLFAIQSVVFGFYMIPYQRELIKPSRIFEVGEVVGFVGLLLALGAMRFAVVQAFTHPQLESTLAKVGRRKGFTPAPTSGILNFVLTLPLPVFAFGLVGYIWRLPSQDRLLSFIRAANLVDGVSILTPLMFIAIAGVAVIAGQLWRLRLLDERRVDLPFLNLDRGTESFAGVSELESEVIERLEAPVLSLPGIWLSVTPGLAFVVIMLMRFEQNPLEHPGFDPPWMPSWFEIFFFWSAIATYFFLSARLLRLALAWAALRKLLRRLWWHPSHEGYGKLGAEQLGSITLLAGSGESVDAIETGLAAARRMGEMFVRIVRQEFLADVALVQESFTASFRGDTDLVRKLTQRSKVEKQMSMLAAQVAELSEPIWRGGAESWSAAHRAELGQQASIFIASRVLDFWRKVLPHLINLAASSMIGVVAMVLAISSYPFPERDTLTFLGWMALLSAVILIMTVFVSINRNPLISALTGGKLGFSWDSTFTVQLLTYAVLPILALLGAQFPNTFAGIFTWLSSRFPG
jgi:hypothetical protein